MIYLDTWEYISRMYELLVLHFQRDDENWCSEKFGCRRAYVPKLDITQAGAGSYRERDQSSEWAPTASGRTLCEHVLRVLGGHT